LASGHPVFLHADTPDPTTLVYPLNCWTKADLLIIVDSKPLSHRYLYNKSYIGDVENYKIYISVGTRTHDHTHDRPSPYQRNHRGKTSVRQSHHLWYQLSCSSVCSLTAIEVRGKPLIYSSVRSIPLKSGIERGKSIKTSLPDLRWILDEFFAWISSKIFKVFLP